LSRQFTGFVLVGLISGAVNVFSRLLFSKFMIYEAAVALAFPVALTVAFVLNRSLVFANKSTRLAEQYAKFAVVNLAALVQVWAVSVGLVRLVFPAVNFDWHAETIAHIAGVASPLLTSFLFYKYWIFDETAELRQRN
jgi:putative flippase GtrA